MESLDLMAKHLRLESRIEEDLISDGRTLHSPPPISETLV
jgi:hypothetical protein